MYLPVLNALERAAQAGLQDVADQALAAANELAPKDTGDMIASGFARVDDLVATVGYSDFVARLQHENLDYAHPDGGQAKFLETAADEIRPRVQDIIGRRVKAALDG